MIASLRGILEEKRPEAIVVEVQGVGYRVFVSERTLAKLPPEGEPVKLRIQTVVREDAFDLFGFVSPTEETLFELLRSVSHVGPKVALNVLSGIEPGHLAHAISMGEIARLTKLNGVGKKTAERIVVELRDKVKGLVETPPDTPASKRAITRAHPHEDLVAALVNLGYKQAQAEKAAAEATQKAEPQTPLETLIRDALRLVRAS